MLHGNKDVDVPLEVSQAFVKEVGEKIAKLVEVEGVGHMFDDGLWLDDDSVGMKSVREAWALVDKAVTVRWHV